jgi:hypothetical protein
MRARDRRNGDRKSADMPIYMLIGDSTICCRMDDLSPSGVRVARCRAAPVDGLTHNLELHLVPNKLTTVLTGRRVWHDDAHEAFEFVSPSFAQQALLERLLENY